MKCIATHAGVNGSALFVQTEINAVKLSDTACSFQVVYRKAVIKSRGSYLFKSLSYEALI